MLIVCGNAFVQIFPVQPVTTVGVGGSVLSGVIDGTFNTPLAIGIIGGSRITSNEAFPTTQYAEHCYYVLRELITEIQAIKALAILKSIAVSISTERSLGIK